MTSASDLTAEHYQRPEVEETIFRCSQDGEAWRCLNGDQGWYIAAENGCVRLRSPSDYDKTTAEFRTLYWTLDFFEPEVEDIVEQWDEVRKRPVRPIGTLSECRAYSLGVDIDAVGHNAFDDPDTTKALEEAATFLIDRLRAAGIEKSVYALCSGGGVYVLIHHALFTAKSEWSGEAREARFRHLLEMYNAFIRDTAEAFSDANPEHIGRVVFDALNGQKRKFKTIFSIHKTIPAAVVPLDPQCIKISREESTIPLSSEVLERGAAWYRDFDPSDKDRLQELLRPYAKAAEEKLERRKTETGSYDLFRRDAPTLPDEWCPLIQRIAGGVKAGEIGRHAALGNLARHLYADGWSMEAAFRLWSPLADQAGVEYRIFDTSFGEISEARCEAINEPRAGYPASSLGGTRFAEACATCPRRKAGRFPSDYAHLKAEEATTSGFTLTDFGEWTTIKKKVIDKETGERTTVDVQKFEFSRDKAARSISEKMDLAMDSIGGDILFFDGQIYQPAGAVKISHDLYSIAKDNVNRFTVKEVLDRLRAEYGLKLVKFDPNPYLLGARNGVIDLQTGEFRDYRPEDFVTYQIDVTYDPAARCPRYLKFLEEIQPNVIDRLTLVDWYPATAIRKPLPYVLFLLGLGRNGKGVYERLIKRFFGASAFRDMALAEVTKNNFAASAFYRKLGWIATEQSGKKKATIGTDFIKLVTGAGVIDADRKNLSRIQFEAYFQAIVDTNSMPKIEDTSIGWMERFCKQDLPFHYVSNPDPNNPLERKKDPHLYDKLTTDDELSGILNLLIWRAREICETEVITKRPASELFGEYAQQSASVSTFCDQFLEYEEGLTEPNIPTTDIYQAYKKWCSYLVGEVVDEAYFGRYIKRFCHDRERSRPRRGDKRLTAYPGLLFHEDKVKIAIDALSKGWTSKDQQGPVMDQKDFSKTDIKSTGGTCGPVELWNQMVKRFGSCGHEDQEDFLSYRGYPKNAGPTGPRVPPTASDPKKEKTTGPSPDQGGPLPVQDDGDQDIGEREVAGDVGGFETSEAEDYQSIAEELEEAERQKVEYREHVRTPEPKARPSEEDIAEALEIAAGLKAQGRRVTFGNVEDFTEARTGEYVEPKVVWRVLKTLEFLGWGTGKDGALSEGVVA